MKLDDFTGNPFDTDEMHTFDAVEPAEWTIVTALNYVIMKTRESHLNRKAWESCQAPFAYLKETLGLTDFQSLFVGIMADTGGSTTWRDFGNFLSCSRLPLMAHEEEMDDLVEKRWVARRRRRDDIDSFQLCKGVMTALSHNLVYVPEKMDGLTIQELMGRLEQHLSKCTDEYGFDILDEESWLLQLCQANRQLPFCEEVLRHEDDINSVLLLLMMAYDYAQWADSDNEGLSMDTINDIFPDDFNVVMMCSELRDGTHDLIRKGLIEQKCVDGIADTECYMLTRTFKRDLLGDYKPSRSKCSRTRTSRKDLKSCLTIPAKEMYYNPADQEQIARLTSLLSPDSLPDVQQRLADKGMRKGIACLFYGAPGTGKTETVLQVARQTGRDIMQIDIAGMRDKYVGESEKNIKAVFDHYRDVCQQSKVLPILFFNEADGIFGKRSKMDGGNPSVEKMDNAMQNIILQELENLDGILIATTNLTCNLDDAFERRFLFKVEFHKPNNDVKAKLWSAMLAGDISDDDARSLADHYEFSGGQIENISRQCTIEFILSGRKPSFDDIENYCRHELLNAQKQRTVVGFNSDR